MKTTKKQLEHENLRLKQQVKDLKKQLELEKNKEPVVKTIELSENDKTTVDFLKKACITTRDEYVRNSYKQQLKRILDKY